MNKLLYILFTLLLICITSCVSDSPTANVPIPPEAKIINHPESDTVLVGSEATFSIDAQGDSLSYQWYRNGQIIDNSNSDTYTIPSVSLQDDQDRYNCIISNSHGYDTSYTVTLTVSNPNEYFIWSKINAGNRVYIDFGTITYKDIFQSSKYNRKYLDAAPIDDASISLYINGVQSPVYLRSYDSSYICDHIVQPGETYDLRIAHWDETRKDSVIFTARTTVPFRDPSLQLSRDTIVLDTHAIGNEYQKVLEEPHLFDQITLNGTENGNYQQLDFSGFAWRLFSIDTTAKEPGILQNCEKEYPRNISQLDLATWRGLYPIDPSGTFSWEIGFYEYYRLIIFQVGQEYVDWYEDGKSNIEGAYGMFAGTAGDTLEFKVKIKE